MGGVVVCGDECGRELGDGGVWGEWCESRGGDCGGGREGGGVMRWGVEGRGAGGIAEREEGS